MFEDLRDELLRTCNNDQHKKIENLESENISLNRKIDNLENKIDEQDGYKRRDTVIISGMDVPSVNKKEICTLLTCSLIKDMLNYVIFPQDISVVHRLGE